MPKLKWSHLNNLQLGRYAEYYAKMDFASYGYQVFQAEVDDHGVDFIARKSGGDFIEVQVKSLSFPKSKYTFLKEKYFDPNWKNFYIYLILFTEDQLPKGYLIPSSVFKESDNPIFKYKPNYKEPEYGINLSMKNMPLLEKYSLDKMLNGITI